MNCNQARSMLAAYRELKHDQGNTTELDVHLEQCAECRQVLAQQDVVGERVRLLPTLEPAPDAHAKLMHALAAEHAQFLQRSSHAQASSASAVPDFLKPYMNEQVYASKKKSETLRAFSTAQTGPLPVIPAKHKKRVAPIGQFAVLGLAASFLMVFLVGGLILLLAMANHGVTDSSQVASIRPPSLIAPVSYTAQTSYSHIASAVATHDHIFYSAYGNDETQWMIEQVNGTAKDATSVPLLRTSSQSQLFVLGASSQWLVWIQLDTPQNKIHKHTTALASTRTWSLNALPLGLSQNAQQFGNVVTLQQGTFDTTTVPEWVHTPIQGTSFVQQDTLLVTSLDAKGNAQFVRYQLASNSRTTSTLVATTNNGHILTSPTANDDGTRIFWSEEWFTSDQQPHSIIWTQDTTSQIIRQGNVQRPGVTVNKHVYSVNDTTFHPQVINDTLFLLSTSNADVSTQGTPSATSTPTLQATAKPVSIVPVTSRFTDMYPSQIDEDIHGTVLAFPLDDPTAQPTALSNDSTAAAPQAGTSFLVWQNSTGYQMYDAFAKVSVEVKDSTKGATFLAVNSDSAVWVVAANSASTKNTTGLQTVTFNMFNWPA